MDTTISAWTADRSHLAPLIELGRTYYPPDHPVLTEGFLQWLYLDNPAGPATLVVAHEDGLWIGLIVLIPVVLQDAGRLQRACYAINVLTHPEHRGKNLFVRMIRHAREMLSDSGTWLLGHPNGNSVRGWQRQHMDFRDPLHVHLARIRPPFSPVRESRIGSPEELQAVPTDFWHALAGRPGVQLQYSADFIAWRFLAAPHRQYRVCALSRHGELLGLRVTRRFKPPFDLMIDFIGFADKLGGLLPPLCRPTLVMHPGPGKEGNQLHRLCWKLPVKREFPFFVTTWGLPMPSMAGITLSASDF